MDNMFLTRPDERYIAEIEAYYREFDGETIHGSSSLHLLRDPLKWIEICRLYQNRETIPNPEHAESDQYMLVRESDGKLCGLINFRHELAGSTLPLYGGHIGYSVRPSERRKGYAKLMLALTLDKCREYGLDKVLITCNPGNEGSRRTILAVGGVYESTIHWPEREEDIERYWVIL